MNMHKMQKASAREAGFTLVELAVVMVIIGVLIGGILKGQELITNARVTSTIASVKAIGAAYNGFIDQFNVQPGDMVAANTHLSNCTVNPCSGPAGTAGNGMIDEPVGGAVAVTDEGAAFFSQLLRANYITSMDGTATVGFGRTNPTAPIGGGFTVGDSRFGQVGAAFPNTELASRPYLVLVGSVDSAANTAVGVVTPIQAGSIDTRMDDGRPNTGDIIVDNLPSSPTRGCRTAAAPIDYDNVKRVTCSMAFKL